MTHASESPDSREESPNERSSRRLRIAGVVLFAASLLLGLGALGTFLTSTTLSTGSGQYWDFRRVAFGLALTGLPLLLASVVALLPNRRRTLIAAAVGTVVCGAVVAVFLTRYPGQWGMDHRTVTTRVVSGYAIGLGILVAATAVGLRRKSQLRSDQKTTNQGADLSERTLENTEVSAPAAEKAGGDDISTLHQRLIAAPNLRVETEAARVDDRWTKTLFVSGFPDSALAGMLDDALAKALAHEDMDPTEFHNRVRALPRGEWIAQVPSPEFQATGTLPFSLEALPVPEGHPDSDERFEGTDERRFQDAVERVHERTAEEFGVPEDAADQPPVEPPAGIRELLGDAADFETAMARIVRQVQLQTGERDANGPVPVEQVDDLLRECVAAAEAETEPPSYETLTEVREASRFVEVGLSDDAERVVCWLTEAGERVAVPTTGDVEAAGGAAHDAALEQVERVLADEGFLVTILEQDRSSMPDARAAHPDLEPTFSVEVETTTATKPIKLLQNLRRAQEAGQVPVFVVEAGEGHRGRTYWAERVERVLAEPVNTAYEDGTRLYVRSEHVTFDGGATAEDGVTAVRPVTDGAGETVWRREDDAFVLTDPSGTEHARVADPTTAPRQRFPATYSYDQVADEYVVHEEGEEHVYDSAEAFEAEWVPVKRPFVPEQDLPVPGYQSDTYAILVLPDSADESAVLYEDGVTCPLGLLSGGTYRPAEVGATEAGIEDPAVATFAAIHLGEREDGVVPVGEAYEAYTEWAAANGFEPTSQERFSRHLENHLSFERDRQYVDDGVARCFVGITFDSEVNIDE